MRDFVTKCGFRNAYQLNLFSIISTLLPVREESIYKNDPMRFYDFIYGIIAWALFCHMNPG